MRKWDKELTIKENLELITGFIMAPIGGFGIGIWWSEMVPDREYVTTIAIGPLTFHKYTVYNYD